MTNVELIEALVNQTDHDIKEFTGAILLISHDRYFVEHIHCDRAITLQNQKIM